MRCFLRQHDKLSATLSFRRKEETKERELIIIHAKMHEFKEGYHTYYVYIITNKNKTVLYIGVTNNLRLRLEQHQENIVTKKNTFASRYNVCFLVHYEKFAWIQEAIAREKELKGWRREKKMELIKSRNPEMEFIEL